MENKLEYAVFVDESKITASRYPSLAAFSFPAKHFKEINALLKEILSISGIQKEYKWCNVKNDRYYNCTQQIIDFILNNFLKYDIHIDCLTWDNHDKRHAVSGRNDIANYERMFFHLLSFAMKKRKYGLSWHIRPDQRNGIDWATIDQCLGSRGSNIDVNHNLLGTSFSDKYFNVLSFKPVVSENSSPVQVADLFSGICSFSYDKYSVYEKWLEKQKEIEQPVFFESEEIKTSNSEEYRFKLLKYFNQRCKSKSLSVSLNTYKHLYTFRPDMPINFWPYVPQGVYDKAPTD